MVSVSLPPVGLLSELHADVTALLSQRHPDKNKDPGAEDMFIKITKSYEVSEKTPPTQILQSSMMQQDLAFKSSSSNPDPVK